VTANDGATCRDIVTSISAARLRSSIAHNVLWSIAAISSDICVSNASFAQVLERKNGFEHRYAGTFGKLMFGQLAVETIDCGFPL
jgi:hypothetical protein